MDKLTFSFLTKPSWELSFSRWVYRKECHGVLLDFRTRGRIVVEYAIPFQSAKRRHTEVVSNWRREVKVIEVLPKLIHLQKLGYFHSHPQWGGVRGVAKLSAADKDAMKVEKWK